MTCYERVAASSEVKQKHEDWMTGRLTNEYPGYKKVRITSGFLINKAGHVICCRHGILKQDGALADLIAAKRAHDEALRRARAPLLPHDLHSGTDSARRGPGPATPS